MAIKGSGSPMEAVDEYFDMLIKSRFNEMFGSVRDNELHLPIKELGSVVEVRNGRDYKHIQNDNGQYPVYGSGGVMTYADEYLCPAETVIIGRKGTINNPILVHEKFWNVDTAFGMICDQSILNPIYFYWFCKNYDFKQHNKATTLPSLTKQDIQKIKLVVPDKPKQDAFATFVQQVDKSKAVCKQIFQSLDNLVKSRFIEMFGKVLDNPVKLSDLSICITKGTTPTTAGFEFTENGVNFVKIENITENGQLLKDSLMHVSQECHDAFRRSQLQKGDILFSIAGAIGRTAVITEDVLPANTNQALAIIRLKDNIINTDYLIQCLHSEYVLKQYRTKKRGAAQLNLSLEDISNLKIPLPERSMQDKFASFIQQVDKSKFEVVQSLLRLKSKYIRTETPSKRTDCDL
ncbi:restriction endonuclease subunit S [Methanomethylophilus alvi]|uniref:restriction endonuclease subunit S n=1 Tax=Methanomethylophilus alvi TaxID=1291540 RepID=UPI0037DC8CB4